MNGALEFTGKITDGKLPAALWERVIGALRHLEGKNVVLSIRELKRRRSNNQNAYMWSVVIRMITKAFRDAGNMVDDDDVYGFLKAEVWKLKQVFVTEQGEVLRGPGSTRKLTTSEMEGILEQARSWAAETLGINIPLPNEGEL